MENLEWFAYIPLLIILWSMMILFVVWVIIGIIELVRDLRRWKRNK